MVLGKGLWRTLTAVATLASVQLYAHAETAASGWEEDEGVERVRTDVEKQVGTINPAAPFTIDPLVKTNPLSDNTNTPEEKSPDVAREPNLPQNNRTAKRNWFRNPKPIRWLSNVGNSTKRGMKATTGAIGKATNSPYFWPVVGAGVAGGAITGLVFLCRGKDEDDPPVEYIQPVINPNTGEVIRVGYWRTKKNNTILDNFSTKGNFNPYTGQWGTVNP